MSSDRDVTHIVRSWLEEGVTDLPDRVLDEVLDQLPTTPQRRAWWPAWRSFDMNNAVRLAIAAATAVVIAFVGIRFLVPGNSVGGPTQTPVPTPTPIATPTPSPIALIGSEGSLPAGRYLGYLVTDPVEDPVGAPKWTVNVEFAVASGWAVRHPEGGGTCCWYINGDRRSISFWPVANVYADACDVSTLPDPPIGPTVDDLITALDAQANTDMSPPIDVTVDGYAGKRFEMTPGKGVPETCSRLSLWPDAGGEPGRGILINGGPGEDLQPVWVIDVDGNRVVIVAWSDGTDPQDAQAIAGVMDSMEFSVR